MLVAPGDLRLESVPVPKASPDDVLIRVRAATTCGTDLKAFLRGHPQIPMPGPLGHEYSGEVVIGGSGFSVGDHVMGVHSAPCQVCSWCIRGQENLCESIMSTKVLGTYAEYLLIPARIAKLNLFLKPDFLSFEVASLLEPLACVAQGVSVLRELLSSGSPTFKPRTLVIGPGAIGLMFVAALKKSGITDVTLAGRSEERLGIGRLLGARTVQYRDVTGEFDFVVECTGKLEVWEKSIEFLARGGHLMLFGGLPSGSRVTFDAGRLHYDQITVVSPFHFGTEAVKTARDWLLDPTLNLSQLLSGTRILEQAEEVFRDLEQGKGIKFVFQP